jgi:hypothetical protein
MDKTGFEQLFHDRLERRLAPLGFVFRGQQLFLRDELNTIALIRLGGRMAQPGTIAHVLCFRHSFLRDMKEIVPAAASAEPHSYPYKFRPSDIQRKQPLAYSSQNLQFPKDGYDFTPFDEAAVASWVEALGDMMEGIFMPWVATRSPEAALAEIIARGNGDWCERLWVDDYEAWLSTP